MKKNLLLITVISAMPLLQAKAYDLSFSDINPNINYNTNSEITNLSPEAITSNALNKISQLNNQITSIDNSVQNSFLTLVSLLTSEKESQTMKSQITQIINNTTLSQTAKSSSVSQLINSYASTLVTDKQNVINKISKMTPSEKATLINTIKTLAQNEYSYLNVAGEYIKTAGSLTKLSQNSANLVSNLTAIKDSANTIRNNANAIKNVLTQVSSIAKSSGVTVEI